MIRRFALLWSLISLALWLVPEAGSAPRVERWTIGTPYGVFFNNYDPNFYTGFAPRVQERERVKIHLGRGNQIRVRMILSDKTIENYLPDQVARHDLYQEVIDKKIITLTSNMAWEEYHEKVMKEGLHGLAKKKASLSTEEWRKLNLTYLDKMVPGRLFHIRKDFSKMAEDFAKSLKNSPKPEKLKPNFT